MDAMHGNEVRAGGTFVDLVDFKWLMAGLGWWVDLSRVRRDPAYAGECVRRGLASDSTLLHQRSVALLPLLSCLCADCSIAMPYTSTGAAP